MMCKTNKVMKIYLATPVNGRNEKTLREKMKAAYERIQHMKEQLRKEYHDARFCSSFDIEGIRLYMYDEALAPIPEPVIMGKCVRMVLESDLVVLDEDWMQSKGCRLEDFVASLYGKQIRTISGLVLTSEFIDTEL